MGWKTMSDEEFNLNDEFGKISDQLDSLVAIVAGYLHKLMAAGFDNEAAIYMVQEFHTVLMKNQVAMSLEDHEI
jgi:hypothetical protein